METSVLRSASSIEAAERPARTARSFFLVVSFMVITLFLVGGTRRFVLLDFRLVLPVPPHFFGLAQRNGVEPQRKALGVVAPP